MDVLFLDANVLFSAAYRDDAQIARLWDLDDVELITSHYAADEARRNLTRPHQPILASQGNDSEVGQDD